MKTITTTLTTTAEFSEDGKKRYLLNKVWDDKKPRLAIIMLAPSEASGIELDSTTLLVLNNASRLGYGSVSVLNLFSTVGNIKECFAEENDKENLKYISKTAETADTIVYASGVGKATNKSFIKRQNQVLDILKKHENKLMCLSNKEGNARFQHQDSSCSYYTARAFFVNWRNPQRKATHGTLATKRISAWTKAAG